MGCRCNSVKKSASTKPPMSLTMLDRHTEPQGGYRYSQIIGDRKHTFSAPTLEILTEIVYKYRLANGVPVASEPALMIEIEDQLCHLAPAGTCRDVKGQVIMSGRTLTIQDVMRGTQVLFDWFLNGKQKVAQELADNRARTCSTCYANVEPAGCSSCSQGKLRELAEKVVGGDSTPHDQYLKSCAYCACQLRAKIWLPVDVLRRHTPEEELKRMPEHCWLVKE